MEIKLKFSKLVPDIWNKLGEIPRSGWIKRGIENPENDQEHTIACRDLVVSLRDELTEFSDEDINEILDIIEVHEYPETIEGDPITADLTEEEKKKQRSEKFVRERNAMYKICGKIGGSVGPEIFVYWLRFEKREDNNADFAKQIDWYQSIEKAWQYQQEGNKVLVQDFINSYRKDIIHPALVKRKLKIEELSKKID
ncbi:HD domain-containing protein [Candidatus Nomurabacteria bacterium]|nr:HD domain-containing protein [Candidatus Nomurabacteria bacterium]